MKTPHFALVYKEVFGLKKIAYLQWLANHSCPDLEVTRYIPEFDKYTKREKVLSCWENLHDEQWKSKTTGLEHNETGLLILGKASEMILHSPAWIIADFEDDVSLDKILLICHKLDRQGNRYWLYHSGSRGHHLHILEPRMLNYSFKKRKIIRDILFKDWGAEVRNSETAPITIPYAKHRRTGQYKKLILESKK